MAKEAKNETLPQFAGLIRRASLANAEFVGGMAEALAKGYRSYANVLTDENIARLDLNNGLIEGTIKGWTVTLEETPKVFKKVLDTLQSPSSAK